MNFDALYETGEIHREALKFLKDAPTIETPFRFYWHCYRELQSERAIGMDLGPIPTRALFAYATEYGLIGRERETLYQVIRALDNRFLQLRAEKAKKEAKENKPVHGGRAGEVIETW